MTLITRGSAADLTSAWKQLRSGEYAEAVQSADAALPRFEREPEWHLIKLEGLISMGKPPEALTTLTNALATLPRDIRLRWMGRQVYLANGRVADARNQLTEITQSLSTRNGYRDVAELVIFGQAALESGADAKTVLEKVFEVAKKADPKRREPYLASGELALSKGDFALAGKRFDEGLKVLPEDADLHFGRARAFAGSDREEANKSLAAALKFNPRHVPSLLLAAGQRIDAEDYEGAGELLKQIQGINPVQPQAAAYQAVIAHLKNDPDREKASKELAGQFWPTNPWVPHWMGAKLSQKYRFAEGAELQREALRHDPDFLPAKAQLANDLLRLGSEADGWDLVQEVHAKDAYDVTMFNLANLHDTLSGYTTLTNAHFVVRMHSKEAEIYGTRVLALLERARGTLVPKYGANLEEPTLVEIFANSKDFGVRTFGMPDNPGYLGVCFGRVVTANSPATNPGGTVNWEAVLWHEYCHVVTLQRTRNKMPRWLSEGISVYEERQADPSWGEQLVPKYREMILGGELTPISKLSAAFLMPKTPLHLQFAYYESSLVVEYLVEQFGLDRLKAVLGDLREGEFINVSLERRTVPLSQLEAGFTAFARTRAESLAPGLSWDKPDLRKASTGEFEALMQQWSVDHPTNFWALDYLSETRMNRKEWTAAQEPLETLVRLYPRQTGGRSASARLARVQRELGETNAERQTLERWVRQDAAAPDACLRLMEMAAARQDWPGVNQSVERYLAVNPLVPAPYRFLALSREKAGSPADAIEAWSTVLKLDPPDLGRVHDHLARLYLPSDPGAARQHTLAALEEAPRNREALQRLLQLTPQAGSPTNAPAAAPKTSP